MLDEAAPVLVNLAVAAHRLGSRTHSPAHLGLAIARYRALLAALPELPEAVQVRWYLAEALFARERWAEAAPEYRAVLAAAPDKPEFADAALAAAICQRRADAPQNGD